MDDAKFKKEIGDTIINKCIEALGRIRAGIQLLVEDDISFDAFCFMNRSMILQRNIMNFSKKHGAGIECAFRDLWILAILPIIWLEAFPDCFYSHESERYCRSGA